MIALFIGPTTGVLKQHFVTCQIKENRVLKEPNIFEEFVNFRNYEIEIRTPRKIAIVTIAIFIGVNTMQ